MLQSMLSCCKLYISESRNSLALQSIERAATLHPDAAIINKFKDEAYNRVGYTLVSPLTENPFFNSPLNEAVVSMVAEAFKAIDLRSHCGTHPRLGVVDHICFHPLAESTLEQSARLAKMAAAAIGQCLQAHEEGRSLASIRRELGYFRPNSGGHEWAGGLCLDISRRKPDKGPSQVDQARGVVVIGATQWVDNYNIPVRSTDMTVVSRLAKRVGGRGGGFDSVQALALAHGKDCIELACNLLEPDRVGADRVQLEVQRLAAQEGLVLEQGYFTDFSRDRIIESYLMRKVD
ncbi:formimidoyltransferase-cyclodeaminase isoform X2 [Phalaenopsis equestris]|uniref:formimidoyltransferase-cyclodeaminase isoform X2 n=1 Tax=Phalaenopsis equestris TaxID=78828 RepID=UPI0009E37935|nr:formimidoyltransferase-cyclodeaminase isoform X2 [Phalaenopsis equestris]